MRREEHVVHTGKDHEPSAWWQGALRECVERVYADGEPDSPVSARPNVTLALGERACDRCTAPERNGQWFASAAVPFDLLLIVVLLCEDCLRAEGVEPPADKPGIDRG